MVSELPRSAIIEATEEKEIVDTLRSHGLNEVAARLAHLGALIADDPDEPDLVIESLQSFTDFFMQTDWLPLPEIGADPEGFVEAEWRIPANGESKASATSSAAHLQKPEMMAATTVAREVDSDDRYWGRGDGILAMKFLSSGLVQFAATSGPAGQGKERLRTSGILPKNNIMPAVQAFASRLAVP